MLVEVHVYWLPRIRHPLVCSGITLPLAHRATKAFGQTAHCTAVLVKCST